jgi:hypothetical protein
MSGYRSNVEFLKEFEQENGEFSNSPADKVYEFGEKLVKQFVSFVKQFVNKVRFQ